MQYNLKKCVHKRIFSWKNYFFTDDLRNCPQNKHWQKQTKSFPRELQQLFGHIRFHFDYFQIDYLKLNIISAIEDKEVKSERVATSDAPSLCLGFTSLNVPHLYLSWKDER